MNRKTKTIVLGSRNPVKVQAVQRAFRRVYPEAEFHIEAVDVPSGVADQPTSEREALLGASNRAFAAVKHVASADYSVGIEGAIEDSETGMKAFGWVVVTSPRLVGKGRTATFYLPEAVAQLVRGGAELGRAVDTVFDTIDAKRGAGAIGLLTRGTLGRAELYEQGVVAALVPIVNPRLFSKPAGP